MALLKWVGGKRQLLPELRRFYPTSFNRYLEPFFGSGAVFFDLYRSDRLRDRDVVLVDSNPDLIACYETVRDAPAAVADRLDELAAGHAERQGHYYEIRDRRFNPLREARRGSDGAIAYTPEMAAMLIYLNRTGFNGLFRVNARGDFNVPAGRYERPRIANRNTLMKVSEALGGPRVQLVRGSFECVQALAEADDFLYFDPPYAPTSRTASFTAYTASRFDQSDQEKLRNLVCVLADRGCRILLSNSSTPEISALYARNARSRRAGFRVVTVPARRAVNSKASRRGPIDEYLITNIERADRGL